MRLIHPIRLLLVAALVLSCAAASSAKTPQPTTAEQEKKLIAVLKSDASRKEKSDACRELARIGMDGALMGGMFLAIRIAGGLYLVYLGIRMFRSSSISVSAKKDKEENKWQTCLSGMLLSLGNP